MPTENLSFVAGSLNGAIGLVGKATPELSDGAQAPSNSEIRKITEDIAGALRYSITAVAANPDQTVRDGSVEHEFKTFLKSLPQERAQKITAVAKPLVDTPVEVRTAMFGRAGLRSAIEHLGAAGGLDRFDEGLPGIEINKKLLGIRTPQVSFALGELRETPEGLLLPRASMPAANLDLIRGGFEEARSSAADAGIVNDERLSEIYGDLYTDNMVAEEVEDGFEELAITDKIGLWITEIKCIDETRPEFWGSDEIALGGVAVDEDGDTNKISERFIGGGFDDGDRRTYGNSWRYVPFSLREGKYWPKRYSVSFALAEKDHGGLNKFLNTIWDAVRNKVKQAIAKAIAGGLSRYLGPVLARAIGEAVAWVVDLLVRWIIDWFKDDIFPVKTVSVTTPSMSARWRYSNGTWGNPSSGIRYVHFYGHGGHYRLAYYWKFYS